MPGVAALLPALLAPLGVLFDTFVVRTRLVPALAVDVGPRLWWPSGLARQHVAPTTDAGSAVPAEPSRVG
ncbi:MAG TPA: hypothetical protein VII16_14095 [Actinomycetes bacterium]